MRSEVRLGVVGAVTDVVTAECERQCQDGAAEWTGVLLSLEWPEKASLELWEARPSCRVDYRTEIFP